MSTISVVYSLIIYLLDTHLPSSLLSISFTLSPQLLFWGSFSTSLTKSLISWTIPAQRITITLSQAKFWSSFPAEKFTLPSGTKPINDLHFLSFSPSSGGRAGAPLWPGLYLSGRVVVLQGGLFCGIFPFLLIIVLFCKICMCFVFLG